MVRITEIGFPHKIGIGRRELGFKSVCVTYEKATMDTLRHRAISSRNSLLRKRILAVIHERVDNAHLGTHQEWPS